MNVRRWDNIVHVVKEHQPYAPQVDAHGYPMPSAYVAHTVCGRNAKINPYSRNQLTEDAPTCVVCAAGGYPVEQE